MNGKQRSERGQVLVLIVISAVVLLGFTALAIDGGMVYSDRRFAQSATDASSLAGGAAAALYLENTYMTYRDWDCSDSRVIQAQYDAIDAAVSRAADNDFSIAYESDLENVGHGVKTVCGEEDTGTWIDKYIDVHTMLTADTRTSFIHFVYGGPVRNTVHAVTRVRPPTEVALGNAVVALREDCPNSNTGGVHYDGTADLNVTGGGIFSNACMVAGGSVDVNVSGFSSDSDGIACTDESGGNCYTENGSPTVNPGPTSGTEPLPPASYLIEPDPPTGCGCLFDATPDGSVHGSDDIGPGCYNDIRLNSSGDLLTMEQGLYCLSGDFVANGGVITMTETAKGVTIFLENGDFDVAGGVEVHLKAPPEESLCDFCPPALPGILIFLAQGNTGEVSLLGTADSWYEGVVYAPDGMIEAGGTGSELETLFTQLIGGTVKLHGTTSVEINYSGSIPFEVPAWLELSK